MIILRQAMHADLGEILEIINHEIINSTINYDFIPKSLVEQFEWFDQKTKAGFPVLVAIIQEQVAGFATYGTFRPKPGYRFTVEHSVYLGEKFRGKGIGTLLLKELIQLAKETGMHTMVGGIDSSNLGSYQFHERLGFKEVARFREIGNKFDRWLDIIFMQLILK